MLTLREVLRIKNLPCALKAHGIPNHGIDQHGPWYGSAIPGVLQIKLSALTLYAKQSPAEKRMKDGMGLALGHDGQVRYPNGHARSGDRKIILLTR
jgi:hypothetical protein